MKKHKFKKIKQPVSIKNPALMDAFSTEKDSLRWNRFAEQAGFELRVKN